MDARDPTAGPDRGEVGGRRGAVLAGRRVVVTRPLMADRLAARVPAGPDGDDIGPLLEAAGAEALRFPAARIEAPEDPAPLGRAAIRALAGAYDWLVFTSANAVVRFLDALPAAAGSRRPRPAAAEEVPAAAGHVPAARTGPGRALPAALRIACVGPATAAALAEHGLSADVVPAEHLAEGLVEAMTAAADMAGARVLFPRAAGARPTLPDGLRAAGAVVEEVEAYRTVPGLERAAELRRILDAGRVDAVTFLSGSAVDGFVAGVGAAAGDAAVAAIGPVTAAVARRHGLRVDVVASEHTAAGLVAALEDFFRGGAAPAMREGGEVGS